jgi:integrase
MIFCDPYGGWYGRITVLGVGCFDRGVSPNTLNATITGLKFLFEVTLDRADLMAKIRPVRVSRTLPVILSREEVGRLIEAARNLKHRTALSVAYGAGLRVSEVIALKVSDVDSKRMVLRVEQGKGRKDRCCHRCYSSGCGFGGERRVPRARFCRTASCFRASTRWSRSPHGS